MHWPRGLFCQSEIQNFGMSAIGHENVRGLDIPVDDALGVRGVERVRHLHTEVQDFSQFQRLAADAVPQRLPLQQLHGDEVLAVGFIDFVDRADIGMVERRGGKGLALESLACGGIVFHFRG